MIKIFIMRNNIKKIKVLADCIAVKKKCSLKTEYRNQSNLKYSKIVKTSEVAKTKSVLVI